MLTACSALISQIYFWIRTLHVSDGFSVHHQESSTVHTAIDIGHTGYVDWLLASSQHFQVVTDKNYEQSIKLSLPENTETYNLCSTKQEC